MEKLLYDRRDAAVVLSVSLRTLDQLISEQKLQVRKIGKRVLVLGDSLKDYARSAD